MSFPATVAVPCPVCRAVNDAGPHCRRCRADLSLLFASETRRRHLLSTAASDLAHGKASTALAHASDADSLRSDADSLAVLAAASLLGRDFASAWRYYQARHAKPPDGCPGA